MFRCDKISPCEKLTAIRNVLQILNLPDIVPEDLSTTAVIVSGPDLRMRIENMITEKDLLSKYNELLKNWSSTFPETRIWTQKLTVGFGVTLTANDKNHPLQSDYILTYPTLPKSDFINDSRWIEYDNDCQAFYGGNDIGFTNQHTAMLRFHIWSINNWFSEFYYDEE